ncbi:MAG: ATP-binding protein [Bdellovibrionales bacterium]
MAVNWLESWLKNRWVHHSLRLAFALLITVLLSPFKLDLIEYTGYDLRMQLTPSPRTSGNVVLIPIEYETLKKLKRDPEALDWAVVLQKIGQAKPAHIVSTIIPSQIQGSYDDLSFLAETAAHLPFTIGQDDLPKTGLTHLDPLPPPFESLVTEPFPQTADTRVGPKDGATRRLILTYENQFTLHPRLAQKFNGIYKQADYAGVFSLLDSTQMLIRYREKGSYPTIKFIDLLEGNVNPELLRGKIILIGKDNLESTVDYVTTPLSKKLLALSQLEMHANILDTLILNQSPHFLPEWVTLMLTFLISLLTIYIVLSVRPGKGLLMLGSSLFVFLVVSLILFAAVNWVVPLAHPLLAVFICYYFVIPYRLIIENRRSWEYYQKNKLLTQVEELKSNFMRMMSHDLKTPLARIQGMAELMTKDPAALTETQKMAMDTIADSSQELMEFIGSILSLSRISAKEMKLQLRSRDVNQVLRNVIKRCDHLATRKNIEIVAELEPLFSIRLDEDLLKTVFTNLLENAIKYSPENSKVLITSEEVNNELVVQFADQGRGIALEEMTHIFERFYRARNSRNDTPGNGLGLFLAKYFVELHNGRIDVESELNKGSTFSVRLPMNLDLEPEQPDQSGGLYV